MFKKRNRLRETKDISNVFKYGKRNVAPHGVFFVYNENIKNENTRFAVIIGKKFSSIAVKRNKIKRIIRAVISSSDYHSAKCDIVVGYTKRNKMLLYKEVKEDIDFLINKINC